MCTEFPARSGGLLQNLGLFALALAVWMGAGLLARRWIRRQEGEAAEAKSVAVRPEHQ